MASIVSYYDLIELFTDISKRHYQINTFFLGKNFELANIRDVQYPCLQVYPEFGRMPISNWKDYRTLEVTMNCKVIDLTVPGEENERDVHSDTLRIAQDIVNEISTHPYYSKSNVSLIENVNFTALEEFKDDVTAGWQFNLVLRITNANTFCGMPIAELDGVSASGPTSTGTIVNTKYLTCATLEDCPIIQDIEDDVEDLDIRVTALEQGGGGGNFIPLAGTTPGNEITGSLDATQDLTPFYQPNSFIQKVYVDNAIASIPASTLAQVLSIGNSTGVNNIILQAGQQIVSSTSTNNLDLNIGNDSVLFSEGVVKLVSDNANVELRGDYTNVLKKLNILTETNQDAELSIATNNGTKRFYLYVKDSNQTVMQYAVNTDNVFFNGPGSTMVETMRLTFDNNALFNGNVGIGTTTPSSKLQIIAPNTLANNYAFKITSTGGASIFDVANDGDLYKDGQRFISSISTNATYMRFGYNVLNNFTPAMSPAGGGDVGIGSNVMTSQMSPQGNVGVGSYVFNSASFNGGRNIGFGTGVGGNITTGTQNLLFGFNTGANFTTGSQNIQMAHEFTSGNFSNTLAFGHNGTITGNGQIVFGGVRQYNSVKFNSDTDLYGFATPSFIHSIADMSTGVVDGAGWDWEFQGSRGTGSGVGGNIIFKVAPSSSTGSTKNALINALVIKQNSEIQINNLSGVGTRMVVADSTGTLSTQTLPSLTGYVPYTGATSNININNKSLEINSTAASNGYIEITRTGLNNIGTPTSGLRLSSTTTGQPMWTNSTGFTRMLSSTITNHRVYTLQDASGTLAFTADITTALAPYLLSTTAASTYEVLANKAVNFTVVDNTLYPTVQAVVNYVTGLGYLTTASAASTYQPLDADLTAIAALSGTSGLLRTNGAGTWTVDTSSYSKVVYKDFTNGTPLTGVTTNTLVKSVLIPANTFVAGDRIRIFTTNKKTGTAGTNTIRYYANTSAAIGGVTIGAMPGTAGSLYLPTERNLIVKNVTTNTQAFPAGTNAVNDLAANAATASTLAIDWTVNQYIVIASQNSVVGDTSTITYFEVTRF